MSTALISRFAHFYLNIELAPWKEWAFANGVNEQIISFLNFRPDALFQLSKTGPYPCPRSWTMASTVLQLGREAVEACVGEGATAELYLFLKINIPDVEKILNGTLKIESKEPSILYALGGALIGSLKQKNNEHRQENFIKALNNIPVDFMVCWVKDALIAKVLNPMLPAFVDWRLTHEKYIV